MLKKKAGNNKYLKELNEREVLNLIRIHKSLSRARLYEITGLSATAIGSIISSLIKHGYIHETGMGESRGGRRPVELELKPDARYSVGVDLDLEYIHFILIDITGNIVYEKLTDMPQSKSTQDTVVLIESVIEQMLKELHLKESKLLGIGLSVPGIVDDEIDKVILAPNLGWENDLLKPRFTKFGGHPIYLENEAMASAIAEHWVGTCKNIDDFVCINIESGIGSGIFVDGKLYRGSGSAGEVGHLVVNESGPRCGCGNYGCLETFASTTRIVDKMRKLLREGIASSLNQFHSADSIDIDMIVRAAREGDEPARSVLLESARYIGIAIADIVNILNPRKIVIGKEFIKYSDLVIDMVKRIVGSKALRYPASQVEIAASTIGDRASALGAAIIPLKALFGDY